MYLGFSADLMMTLFNETSASSIILNAFLSSPLANAILPNSKEAFDI